MNAYLKDGIKVEILGFSKSEVELDDGRTKQITECQVRNPENGWTGTVNARQITIM